MKCKRCQGKAEVHLRQHNAAFCRGCFIFFLQRQVQRAIEKQRMFTRDEEVLVAVSGGKDSLALVGHPGRARLSCHRHAPGVGHRRLFAGIDGEDRGVCARPRAALDHGAPRRRRGGDPNGGRRRRIGPPAPPAASSNATTSIASRSSMGSRYWPLGTTWTMKLRAYWATCYIGSSTTSPSSAR